MQFPMPEDDPCLFCEIVNGNTHQWKILEENEVAMTAIERLPV
ncbi:MAG: hypothetical protein RLN92_09040 [Alloalcanivorax xenomutans]